MLYTLFTTSLPLHLLPPVSSLETHPLIPNSWPLLKIIIVIQTYAYTHKLIYNYNLLSLLSFTQLMCVFLGLTILYKIIKYGVQLWGRWIFPFQVINCLQLLIQEQDLLMFKKEVSLLVSCCSKILGTLLTNHLFITCTIWLQIFLPSLLHAFQLVPHHTQHASKSIL